jgi:hypothetical protein
MKLEATTFQLAKSTMGPHFAEACTLLLAGWIVFVPFRGKRQSRGLRRQLGLEAAS